MSVNLKSLIAKLSPKTRAAMENAAGMCVARTHYDIEIEHVLLKLLDSTGTDFALIVKTFELDHTRFTGELSRAIDRFKEGNAKMPSFSPHLITALVNAWTYGTMEFGSAEIRTGFVLAAVLEDDQLSKLVLESSPQLQKVVTSTLRERYATIVRGSEEGDLARVPVTAKKAGPRVFISYRHADSSPFADFLFDRLRAEVHDIDVFRDSDSLKPGVLYAEQIEKTVSTCDIFLALIGKRWLGALPDGSGRRIDLVDDWVRLEVAAALKQDKLVIPCLVGSATMPDPKALPVDVAGVTMRQAVRISERNRRRDSIELIELIRNWSR